MGIRSYGNELSPELPITFQYVFVGIWMSKAIGKASCVQFQAGILFHKKAQDLIQLIPVFCIRIKAILIGTVADNVIDMAVYIKAGEGWGCGWDSSYGELNKIGFILLSASLNVRQSFS